MQKKQQKIINKWLVLLTKKLSGLKTMERKDIIENYKEMWNEEINQGKSVSEVLLQLRPIDEIAKELYEEFGVFKKTKTDITKIKIVSNKADSASSLIKTIQQVFTKFFASIYSVIAIFFSITLFIAFLGTVLGFPAAIILTLINYNFLVALPIVLVLVGAGIILGTIFYYLSSTSYKTVQMIFKRWLQKDLSQNQKKRFWTKLMLVVIIIAGSITSVGAISATLGQNSMYGSLLSGKLIHENEVDDLVKFNLQEEFNKIPEQKITDSTYLYIHFGNLSWSYFELHQDTSLNENTMTVQKNYNIKKSLGAQYNIKQKEPISYKEYNSEITEISLYFKVTAPWNAWALSITPMIFIISHNISVAGLNFENIIVTY